jgi:hypothetical protein
MDKEGCGNIFKNFLAYIFHVEKHTVKIIFIKIHILITTHSWIICTISWKYFMLLDCCKAFRCPGLGVKHPLPSNAEVKEKVELYFYFPSEFSWQVIGRT